VQPFAQGKVAPGHSARFAVLVWSTGAAAKGVSVHITASGSHTGSPAFTVCPAKNGATCTIGGLPTGQTDELQVVVPVHRGARAGGHVHLSASASGSGATGDSSAASVPIGASASSGGSGSGGTGSGGTGSGGVGSGGTGALPPATTGGGLPGVSVPAGGTSSAADPSGLFPTVSPSPSTSSAVPAARTQHKGRRVRMSDAAATLPLSPRLIGGQLLGLAVLAGAIAMAVTRLSLRTQQDGKGRHDNKGKSAR
jgi:hypothetical protein